MVAGLLGNESGVAGKGDVCTGGVSSCGGSDSRLGIKSATVPYPLSLPLGTMLQCFRRRRFRLLASVVNAGACCCRYVLGADGHQS